MLSFPETLLTVTSKQIRLSEFYERVMFILNPVKGTLKKTRPRRLTVTHASVSVIERRIPGE